MMIIGQIVFLFIITSTSNAIDDDFQWNSNHSFTYPVVYRNETIVDELFGFKVHDPYRWLEDAKSNQTREFVRQQNAITEPYLESCPHRQQIRSRLKQLLKYERFGCPFKRGNDYYVSMNSGLQNHRVLYRMKHGINVNQSMTIGDNLEVFFDPNKLSKDGTISLSMSSFSKDGKFWAYGLQKSGSDWNTIKIRSIENGTDFPEELINIKFSSISWTKDNRGFFYSRYPNAINTTKRYDGTEIGAIRHNKLYYHRIGTDQKQDVLIYETPDEPINRFYGIMSDCGHYLHMLIKQNSEYEAWYYRRLRNETEINGKLEMYPISDGNANYEYLANDGPIHFMMTNYQAPNYRVIKINLTDHESRNESRWQNLIDEHPTDVLRSVRVINNDILVCHYIHDVMSRLELRNLTNGRLIRNVDIPIGVVTSITGQRHNNTDLFFSITSFLMPANVYYLNLSSTDNKPVLYRKTYPKNFNASNFITKQTFFKSKDGTKVPLFIVHKKDMEFNGERPALLYGYGGFNNMMRPNFISTRMILLEDLNGTFALAGIRGGGEYGKRWHQNGKLLNKQNGFDDFIEAAKYLIKQNYTSSNKLIIEGGSNGGLLVAAVSNQQPDLFGCSICRVGVLDMLRFHKFTIGHSWISEYGDPDQEKYFRYLLRYSPLHNIPKNSTGYPATLLLTAEHDDRVVPLHSYKHVSELQYSLGRRFPRTPFMIRIDTDSGHGGGKPTEKIIEDDVDVYSFIINSLSLKFNRIE